MINLKRYSSVLIIIIIFIIPVYSSDETDSIIKLKKDKHDLMTRGESLKNVAENCPDEILEMLQLVNIEYINFKGEKQTGQLVIHRELVGDIKRVFKLMVELEFPLESVIPLSHSKFNWDDNLSMEANNTSSFNFRLVPGRKKLSKHSYGCAIDINPLLNPWFEKGKIYPVNAEYDSNKNGTLTGKHVIVDEFKRLGWTWGGEWRNPDYQHFQKIPESLKRRLKFLNRKNQNY